MSVPKITARELYDLIISYISTGDETKYCWVDGDTVFEGFAAEINALIERKIFAHEDLPIPDRLNKNGDE